MDPDTSSKQQTLDLGPEPDLPGGIDEDAGDLPEDWRINNARSIRGCSLIRRRFRGKQVQHCTPCWAKFSEAGGADELDEGYATFTGYDWVCGNCYEELRFRMQWRLAPARVAELLTTGGGRIHRAHEDDWIPDVRAMFLEYAQSLGVDLGFQDFDRELAELPGEYNRALGKGALLVGTLDERPVGVVGIRPWHHHIEDAICEMKRLYVRPRFRRTGMGEALARAALDEARSLGYAKMRLDSLPAMEDAQRLYVSLGFVRIEPYRYNPAPDTVYMELSLH